MKMSKQIINGQEFDVHDDGAVRYDEAQTLPPEKQAQARANIGAAAVGGGDGGTGLTDTARALLITILRNGVFTSDQSANITALEAALAGGGEDEPDEPVIPDEPDEPDVPEKTLTSISATYSGGDVAVGTALNDLTGIVVTAHYSDGSTATVTGYTLSGTIAEGNNTITVSYGGKTTTFTVTGVAESGGFVYDPSKWLIGYIINASTGELESNAGSAVYDEWIQKPSSVVLTVTTATHLRVRAYDENKQFVEAYSPVTATSSTNLQATVNTNHEYIKVSIAADAIKTQDINTIVTNLEVNF